MLGTDYPFPLGEMDGNGRLVATAKISEDAKKKVMLSSLLIINPFQNYTLDLFYKYP